MPSSPERPAGGARAAARVDLDRHRSVDVRRLSWVAPATVIVAVGAVKLTQMLGVITLTAIGPRVADPAYVARLGRSTVPMLFTGVLVTAGVIVFAVVARQAINPLRTYRRIAFAVLIVSFLPDIAAGFSSSWARAILFMVMHVVAWAVTVTMLTRLTATDARQTGGP